MTKQLYLGTANWGKSVSKTEALSMLDAYFGYGNDLIDSSTNYPINNQARDYGLALTWLAEWLSLNSQSNLKIFVKIGSINNNGGSENDLSVSAITNQIIQLQDKFGENLYGVGIHWDNRDSNCKNEILDLIFTINEIHFYYNEDTYKITSYNKNTLRKDDIIMVGDNIFEILGLNSITMFYDLRPIKIASAKRFASWFKMFAPTLSIIQCLAYNIAFSG
jgi:uncharacterized protein YneR